MTVLSLGNKIRQRPPRLCGRGEPAIVIGSVGTSADSDGFDAELDKVRAAVDAGADAVTDHSFFGDLGAFQKVLCREVDCLVSTVSSYEFAARYKKRDWPDLDPHVVVDIFEDQVKRGLDMITVHADFRRENLVDLSKGERIIPMTAKGAGILASYMRVTGKENPYFLYFDEICQIAAEYNATISTASSFRTGSVADSWDSLLAAHLDVVEILASRAARFGAPLMVEGLGHVPIDAIPTHIALTNIRSQGAPYRMLPMATDRALGYDHISGAIATAVGVAAGASVVTAMSRAEHVGLPSIDDVVEAVIAARIAVESGQLVQIRDFDLERRMSEARWRNGCKGDWRCAIYPDGARDALLEHGELDSLLIQCSMCGNYCGLTSALASARSTQEL